MIRLFIDDIEIDLNPDTEVVTNYSNADIEKLSRLDVKGNFSFEFDVPGTKSNKQTFGFPELKAVESFDETQERTARLEDDGNIIINGFARIKKTTTSGNNVNYSILLYDGNSGWIKSIKGLTLRDIDFTGFDHNLTLNNIVNSWNENIGGLYRYGIVDYGTLDSRDFKVKDLFIFFSVRKVLQDIFLEQGYTIESDFYSSNFMAGLYFSSDKLLTRKKGDLIPHKFAAARATKYFFTELLSDTIKPADSIINQDSFSYAQFTNKYTDPEPLPNVINLYNDGDSTITNETVSLSDGSNITGTFYKVNGFNGRMSFSWDYSLFSTRLSELTVKRREFNVILKVKRIRNGNVSTIATRDELIPKPGSLQFGSEVRDNFTTKSFEVMPGDRYYFTARLDTDVNVNNWAVGLDYYCLFKNKVYNSLTRNAPVEISEQIPDIDQTDFIKAIKSTFNLYFDTDEVNKIVYFEPRDTFYTNGTSDISDKLDLSKPIELISLGSNLTKTIEFAYGTDSSDKLVKNIEENSNIPFYSQRETIDNKSARDGIEQRRVDLLAPTLMVKGAFDNLTDVEVPRIWNDDERPTKVIQKFKTRLLYYRGRQSVGNGVFKFEGNQYLKYPQFTVNYLDYSDSSLPHLNSLTWSNTDYNYGLVDRYFDNTLKTINEGHKLTAYFNFKSIDIQNFDFRKQYYIEIEGDGNYYVIQSIKGYNPSVIKSVKCELISVLEPVPLPEKLNIETSNIFEIPGKEQDQDNQDPIVTEPETRNLVYTETVFASTSENPDGEFIEIEVDVMCFETSRDGNIKNNMVNVVI